jgi:hypothetical protein
MKFNLKNRPTEVFEFTKESMLEKIREWQIWAEGLEAEIVKVLDLAEGQIKLWEKSLAELKKPKRGTASHEYERIERMILIWKQIKRFCQQILGEEENENYNS